MKPAARPVACIASIWKRADRKCCTSACIRATRPRPIFTRFFWIASRRPTISTALLPSACPTTRGWCSARPSPVCLWSKQFYHYVVEEWLKGDPAMPPPPPERLLGRNRTWIHVYNDDVLSMPDKWEYPWFAAWDLAFHTIPLAMVDPDFAKQQLSLAFARVVSIAQRPASGL